MAAGNFAIVAGSAQAIPTTTWALLDCGNISSDVDNILTETSAGVYRPDSSGYYLITVVTHITWTNNNRANDAIKIQKGTSDIAGAYGSGYARNANNNQSWSEASMIQSFDGNTDTFRVLNIMDVGVSPTGAYTNTYIKVVQLTDGTAGIPFAHYGTPTAAAHGGSNTWSDTAGWDVITETDTSVIQVQTGDAFRFKETGRPYLVVYGLANSDAGSVRTTRISRMTFNASQIDHSFGNAYQRNSTCQYAFPSGTALIRPTVANQDAKLQLCGYFDNKAIFWGTFNIGAWTLDSAAGTSGVMIIALPDTTNIAIYNDTTTSQNVSLSTDVVLNGYRDQIIEDVPFSNTSISTVQVTTATNILGYGSIVEERTASSGIRLTMGSVFDVGGTAEVHSIHGIYERGDQSTEDGKIAVSNSILVKDLALTTNVEFAKTSPAIDDGGNNTTSYVGTYFIDLDSLVTITAPTITNVDDEDFEIGEIDITVTGINFKATQGIGKLELGDSATYASAIKVVQSIDTWANTSIQFDLIIGSLNVENLWLYVTDSDLTVSNAYAVTVNMTPIITTVGGDDSINFNELNVALVGTVFENTQGTGKVEISNNAVYATGTKVAQSIDSWSNTSIQFDTTIGALTATTLWVWVTNNLGFISLSKSITVDYTPTITNVDDEIFEINETNITLTGTLLDHSQGTGKLELGNNSVYASATKVTQNIDTWSDTSIQFDLTIGGLTELNVWLFVTNDVNSVSIGYPVRIARTPTITNVEDESFTVNETNIILDGTYFEDIQNTGKLEISNNSVYATGTKVSQVINSWNNTQLNFDLTLGAIAQETMWLWVTNDVGKISTSTQVTITGLPITDGLWKTTGIQTEITTKGLISTIFLTSDEL